MAVEAYQAIICSDALNGPSHQSLTLFSHLSGNRNLPYIVVSNPHISRIYGTYLHSLETLLPFYNRQFASLDDELHFTDALADLVQTPTTHSTTPLLASQHRSANAATKHGRWSPARHCLDPIAFTAIVVHWRHRHGTAPGQRDSHVRGLRVGAV